MTHEPYDLVHSAAYDIVLPSYWAGLVPPAQLPEVPPGREDGAPLMGLHRRVRDGAESRMREVEEAEDAQRLEVHTVP